jgi:hypothetical protein
MGLEDGVVEEEEEEEEPEERCLLLMLEKLVFRHYRLRYLQPVVVVVEVELEKAQL